MEKNQQSPQVKKPTTLVLKKQSLRNLTDLQLEVIAGGKATPSEPHGSPSD
jgi:hypothetical protein